jgi:hypothetical protein
MNILQMEIYETIMTWQLDHGESLLDQGFDLRELTFMTWCLGRKYITPEQFNIWNKAWAVLELEAIDANYYVYNSDGVDEVPWAVVSSDEWNDEDYKKAYLILAEFISEMEVYQNRLNKFVKGEDEE